MAKAPKMTLPAVNLDLTLVAGRMKAISSVATGKATEYIVPVDQLRVLPGFNVRVRETDDYRQHVENLKQSIRENGFYQNKALAGFVGKEGDDDVIYVTDGHTRLEAVQEMNAEALSPEEEIAGLPVILKPADATMADLTIALVQDNSGRPLTPYEMGVVVQRLQGMKDGDQPLYTKSDIAKRLSITERYIDDLSVLVSAPAKVRDAVLRGSVSSTLAIQELRKNPKKAEERIVAAVAKATSQGKKKATAKDVGSVRMVKVRESVSLATGSSIKDALKAVAAQVRKTVGHDDADVLTTDGTITIIMEVPAPPAEPKPAKAAAPKKAAAKKATPAKKAAAAPKVSKAAAAKAGADMLAETLNGKSEATSDDDGEPVKLPPAVPTTDVGDADDI
jgi:ParB family chromosome partitioning protein